MYLYLSNSLNIVSSIYLSLYIVLILFLLLYNYLQVIFKFYMNMISISLQVYISGLHSIVLPCFQITSRFCPPLKKLKFKKT